MKIQAKFMAIVLVAATLQVPIENAAHASTTSDLLDGSWTIEASDSQANVTWDLPSNSAEVKLYHEGELVASDFGSGFLNIPEVTPLEVLEFEIKVETPLAKSKAIQIANETGQSVDLVRSSYVRISGSNMTLRVPAAGTASISSADAVTTLPDYTIIRYQTFIPNYSVNAPLPVCAPVDGHNYRFLGDNRGFDATASSYRTRFDVRVNWINNTAISPTRTVGITTRQKQDPVTKVWEFDGTAVASNDKMDLTLQGTQTSNHATFNIRQDVTNPYCIFPPAGFLRTLTFLSGELPLIATMGTSFERQIMKCI